MKPSPLLFVCKLAYSINFLLLRRFTFGNNFCTCLDFLGIRTSYLYGVLSFDRKAEKGLLRVRF